METLTKNFFLISSIFFLNLMTVECLKCYRCTSTSTVKDPYQCNEFFDDSELTPQSCDDVYNARYCIKQTGRFEGDGIKCFECDSAWDISCTDVFISDGTLEPQDCGGLGTKRFCASSDMGNYCHYVRQPGDVMEYRSCYFTCTGDGCNSTSQLKPFQYLSFLLFVFLFYYFT